MKKVLLLIGLMTVLMTGGLVYGTTPAPWGMTGTAGVSTFTWSPDLYVSGYANLGLPHASHYIGYDSVRKTSCIMIEFGATSPRIQLWAFENENPKLYNDIKNAIQNHFSGRKVISSYFDYYYYLCFGYIGNSDGLNIIQVVTTKYNYEK
jgi:hypothetical protein